MRSGGRSGFQRTEGSKVKEKPTQNDKLYNAIQKMKKKQAADALARKASAA